MSKKKIIVLTFLLAATLVMLITKQYKFMMIGLVLMIGVKWRQAFKKLYLVCIYVIRLILKRYPEPKFDDGDYELNFIDIPGDRKLYYSEFGDPNGLPVFYFHGSPSSRLEALLVSDAKYKQAGLRIIAPNRPGIGYSTMTAKRKFTEWPNDVVILADHLGIDKFAVLGMSGGAPYVAACAAAIPGRLLSLVIVSGAWQMNRPEARRNIWERNRLFWKTVEHFPVLVPFIMKSMRSVNVIPNDTELEVLKRTMTEPDYEVIKAGSLLPILNKTANEAVFNSKGAAYDVRMYILPWDIDLSLIQLPITFFHGIHDKTVPVSLAETVADTIPNAVLIKYEDEGHLSVFVNRFNNIAAALQGKVMAQIDAQNHLEQVQASITYFL